VTEQRHPPETDEPDDALDGVPPSPPPVRPVVVPRWIQLVALPLGLLALWALARAAHTVLLVFLVAAVVALILNPLVNLVQRPLGGRRLRLPRTLAVFGVYIGFFLGVVGAGVLLAAPITAQVQAFQRDVPDLVHSANRSLAHFQGWLDKRGVNVKVKEQGQTALQTLQRKVLSGSGSLVSFGQDLLTRLVETGFALVLVIVISIYMLLYSNRIGAVVGSIMPAGDGTPQDDYAVRVQRAVFSYVRAQLLFSALMGAGAAVAMWLLGVTGVFPSGSRYALFFGIFYGLMELVPYIGPVLGAVPAVLVALFNEPISALWVALTFLALQQTEGHVVAPQVFGHSLRINPLIVIFALLVGGELYGIVGALIALPLAAVVRETVVYLRRHLVLEPWGVMSPTALVAGPSPAALPRPACVECGALPGGDDAFCRSCGAPLGPRVTASG
jgi:predicted PurR-regulated permease PerM